MPQLLRNKNILYRRAENQLDLKRPFGGLEIDLDGNAEFSYFHQSVRAIAILVGCLFRDRSGPQIVAF